MAKAKTAISFGLVHIPVDLNPVIKNNDASFNQLHKKCGSRIKYQKICPHCHVEVQHKDIVKAYEYVKDEYITFEDEELNQLKTEADNQIEIISFVNLKEIDPIYFEKSYYLTTTGNVKAFGLFKKALNDAKKVAIARAYINNKLYYVVLRFGQDNIIMNTLYYEEEIRLSTVTVEEEYSKAEVELASQLIESMSGKFNPNDYVDDYQNRIKEAIQEKVDGKKVKAVKKKAPKKNISDLMQALQLSLKEAKK